MAESPEVALVNVICVQYYSFSAVLFCSFKAYISFLMCAFSFYLVLRFHLFFSTLLFFFVDICLGMFSLMMFIVILNSWGLACFRRQGFIMLETASEMLGLGVSPTTHPSLGVFLMNNQLMYHLWFFSPIS